MSQKNKGSSNIESHSIEKSSNITKTKAYEIEFDDKTKYHVKVGVSKYQKLKISY